MTNKKMAKWARRIRLIMPKQSNSFRSNLSKDDFFCIAKQRYPVLDTDLKFAFFSHNKVAQTSINRHVLRNRAIVHKDSTATWNYALQRQQRLWSIRQPFSFTIVRNPYTRTMSAFFYLQKIGKISSDIELNNFILSVLAKHGTGFDPHFEPQEHFDVPISQMGFDAIIRIEELQQRWPDIAHVINAPYALPRANITQQTKDTLYLSDEAKHVIAELYKNDFEQLGYQRINI